MSLSRPIRVATASIASVQNLCATLSISNAELDEVLALDDNQRYVTGTVSKADGTSRVIHKPHRLVRRIQRRINKIIFSQKSIMSWPDFIYGSLPNQKCGTYLIQKDYVACAAKHCGAKSLLKLDIKDFFDNIEEALVKKIFLDVLKYPDEVAAVLSNICCFQGRLVQGALTSSYLACLCLYDVEGDVVRRLANKGLIYTRFVDDITVSSKLEKYDFDYGMSIIRSMLEGRDLPINAAKTKIQRMSSEALLVHGLRISFKEPRLPSDEVRRIRAAVRNVECLAQEANYRTSHSYRHDFNRCMGRVNKLGRVGHIQHKPLVKRLVAIYPLPSFKDIDRIILVIDRLKKENRCKKNTFWYSRRFFLAHERLNVLKRSFPQLADGMRKTLRDLRPTYV